MQTFMQIPEIVPGPRAKGSAFQLTPTGLQVLIAYPVLLSHTLYLVDLRIIEDPI